MTRAESQATRTGRYASLFRLPPEAQLRAFADMRGLYPTRVIERSERIRELPPGPTVEFRYEAGGPKLSIADFMQRCRSTGLLLLKRGRVVCERYALGHTPDTRWISFSMAKSITSTLVGAAIHDGLITGLDEAVTRTVPRLRGSAAAVRLPLREDLAPLRHAVRRLLAARIRGRPRIRRQRPERLLA